MENPTATMGKSRSVGKTVAIVGMPHVVDIGLVRDVPGHARRQLDFWVFGFVLAGSLGLQLGDRHLVVQVGQYYVIPEDIPHHGTDAGPFDAAFFHFVMPTEANRNGPALTEIEVAGDLPDAADYEQLFRFIEGHYRRGRLNGPQAGYQLLAIMDQIAAVQRRRHLTTTATSRDLAGAVLELIRTNYRDNLTSRVVSDHLRYSYTHLERAFRAEFGSSIHQQLLRTRVDAAAHGLQMGKSIKEVARDTGFDDYYYFLKTFKRLWGATPATYQRTFHDRVAESGTRAVERLRQTTSTRIGPP